jgi:peroxiredoxin
VALGAGVLAALALAGVVTRAPSGPTPAAGSPAPAFEALTLAGARFDSGSLRGAPVLLNFWATWCAPCVEEMPALERLHRDLGPEGLRVLAVSVDDDPLAATGFAVRHGLTLTTLRDFGGRAAAAYGVEGLPTTFVIDAQGVVRDVYVGPVEWDSPGAAAHLRKLLVSPR